MNTLSQCMRLSNESLLELMPSQASQTLSISLVPTFFRPFFSFYFKPYRWLKRHYS